MRPSGKALVRLVGRNASVRFRFGSPLSSKLLLWSVDTLLWLCSSQCLKTAIVKPLLKKPSLDKNLLKNYRPISNLPFLSKILEKVVLHKLLSHLQENNLSNPFQSAYRAGCSTETVLLRIVNDILSALDNDNISVLLLLGLSAAFDTLDHQILFSRLNSVFGIQSTALQWFHSYLSDRYQSTSVNNSSSSPSQLMYGVPQGPVLGPILFVLYTTPLSDIRANHSVNHQLFADDTRLQKSAPLNEVTNLTKELNACTDNIKTWMTENQLKLNDDKTEALLFPFSSSLKPSTGPLPDSITLGSHNIPFSDSARNLGFILDSKLSMTEEAHHKKSAKLLISSLNALVQSAGFSLKTQPRLLLLPTSFHGLTTATVSLWVHLILSSNLSRKFRTLLQDLFSWHPVITTQHLSWKNCTGFPFQNVLSIKSLVCVSVL